ncbi:MAG: PilZ domain-containing protein [Bryobacterales bacterium]|nr:PilZ domain-containing protein [Bryobacterales bacterium]
MNYERREKVRYPIELNARYHTAGLDGPVGGIGRTVNISSRGMLLACKSNIPEGARLTIFVEWPSLLNGNTPLQLITVGTVVRRDPIGLSIACESYQFRTMGRTRPSNLSRIPETIAPTYGGGDSRFAAG